MNTSYDKQSLAEAIERLTDRAKPSRRDLSSVSNSPSQSWDLNTGFENARELAARGWEDKAGELWRQVRSLALQVEVGVRESYDVAGGSVDIGRYMSGEPECMIAPVVSNLSTVAVLVNISARANASAECLYNRGIAIAAVIHALQSSGRGVSLRVVEVVKANYSDDRHITDITLQEFGDYINPGRLAFWTAHPAALRRCVFRYNEQQSSELRGEFGFVSGGGYGEPTDLKSTDCPQGSVYIPFPETSDLHRHYRNPASALKQVVAEFKSRGVPVDIQVD
jgi:hypothetical protein